MYHWEMGSCKNLQNFPCNAHFFIYWYLSKCLNCSWWNQNQDPSCQYIHTSSKGFPEICSQGWYYQNLAHCCHDSTIDKLSDEISVDLNRVTQGQCSGDFPDSADSIQLCNKQGTKENLWKERKYISSHIVTTWAFFFFFSFFSLRIHFSVTLQDIMFCNLLWEIVKHLAPLLLNYWQKTFLRKSLSLNLHI